MSAYKFRTPGNYPEESIKKDNYRLISLKKRTGMVIEALVYSRLKRLSRYMTGEVGYLVRVLTPCGHLGGNRRFELEDDGTEQPGVA